MGRADKGIKKVHNERTGKKFRAGLPMEEEEVRLGLISREINVRTRKCQDH